MKITLDMRKPRNPLVAPSLQRRAGVHRRSTSALRQQASRELKGEWPRPRP